MQSLRVGFGFGTVPAALPPSSRNPGEPLSSGAVSKSGILTTGTMTGWLSLRSRPVSDGNLTLWRQTSVAEPGGAGAIDEGLTESLPVG
jgi:hypothetical protein